MKKMAGMQMHTVNDPMNREILKRQIVSWDENLEKLLIEQYQLRCYLSALEGSGLPCAKVKKLHQTAATELSVQLFTGLKLSSCLNQRFSTAVHWSERARPTIYIFYC